MANPLLGQVKKMAADLVALRKRVRTLENRPILTHAALDNKSIRVKNREGEVAQIVGRQFDGSFGDRVIKSGAQPKPSPASLRQGPGATSVRWDGTAEFGGQGAVPQAFGSIHVYAAHGANASFSEATHLSSIYSREGGTTMIRTAASGVWKVWLVMVGADGTTMSIPSAPVLVEIVRLFDEQDFRDRLNDFVEGDLEDAAYESLMARLGEFAVLRAGNIEANAIRGEHIEAGALDGKIITGPLIQSSHEPNQGTKMDNDGFVGFDNGGNITVVLNGEVARIAAPQTILEGDVQARSLMLYGDLRVGPNSEGRISSAPGGRMRIEGRFPEGIAPRDSFTAGATPFISASNTYNRVTINYGAPAWQGGRIPFAQVSFGSAYQSMAPVDLATQNRGASSFTALVKVGEPGNTPQFSISYFAVWADFQ